MSIDVYEEITNRYKLYEALQTGLDQIKNGETISGQVMMKKNKNMLVNRCIVCFFQKL